METIADVAVGVSADTSDLPKQITEPLEKATDQASDSAGKKSGKKFGGKFTAASAKWLKRGAKVGAAGFAGVVGTALVKGFGRLKAIDQATSQLRGLKLEGAEIKGVMDSATEAVTGTAYGLDAAASAAAGALGAGVKQGEALTEYLKLVADATSQSTTDFNSMALMMNKVQGQGKLTGDVLLQMAKNGLYVMPMLADALGKPQEEIQKMVSKGQISAKQFQSILKNNIGGAAQESGKTFSGALANMGAALGRLGAKVLGGVFPKLAPMFAKITGWLDRMGPAAEKFGSMLGDGFTRLGDFLGPLESRIGKFFDSLSKGSKGASTLGAAFGPLVTNVGRVLAALAPLGSTLADIGQQILSALGPTLQEIGAVITGTVMPAVSDFIGLLATIIPYVMPVAQFFLSIFGGMIVGAIKAVGTIIKGLLTVLSGVLNFITGVFTGNWSTAWQGIKQIFSGALTAIIGAVRLFFTVGIGKAFSVGFKALRALASKGWSAIRGLFTKGIAGIRGAMGRFVSVVTTPARTAFNALKGLASKGLSAMLGPVRTGISKVAGAFKTLKGKITGAIGNASSMLSSIGRNIVAGLGRGISGSWSVVQRAIKSITDRIPKKLRKWLGIASPSKVTTKIGRWVTRGLAKGMIGALPETVSAVKALAKVINTEMPKNLSDKAAKKWRKDHQKELLGAFNDTVKALRKDARARVKAARAAYREYANAAADSARSFGALSNLEAPEGGSITAGGIADYLKTQKDRVVAFTKDMAKLSGKISKSLYDQIVQMGPEQGAAYARALATATPAELKAINAQQNSLNKASKRLGTTVANTMRKAGVDSAIGFQKGLESRIKRLEKAGVKISKALVKSLKKALGIKSPSRVTAALGQFMAQGLARGFRNDAALMDKAIVSWSKRTEGTLQKAASSLVQAHPLAPQPVGGSLSPLRGSPGAPAPATPASAPTANLSSLVAYLTDEQIAALINGLIAASARVADTKIDAREYAAATKARNTVGAWPGKA